MGTEATGFKLIWAKWRAFARRLGHFNGLVLLTILYWLVISLVSLCFAIFRQDPLQRRRSSASTLILKHLRTESGDYQHIY